jgi:hypothetical protein
MATTTPNFGWDIPQSTDLVKDGATAIAALGTDIDTALVDLKGGTTGQVLSKNSNTDLDFTWVAQDDSNAIQNALLTTTGDTIYASSASTPARLGIGSNGQVLTVSGGVPAWTTIGTALPPLLVPLTTAAYYSAASSGGTMAESQNTGLSRTFYLPVYLPAGTYDRISIRTGTNHLGTGTVRLGLYNVTDGKPSTVKFDAGTVSASAASTTYEITINQTLTENYYYLAFNEQANTDGAGSGYYFRFNTPDSFTTATGTNGATFYNRPRAGFLETGITGAFATAGTLTAEQSPYIVALRRA